MTMPSSIGTAPPDRLVPLPRAMKGTRASWHRRTVSMTSSADSARTTARGRARNVVRPSRSRTGQARPDASAADPAGSGGGERAAAGPRGCIRVRSHYKLRARRAMTGRQIVRPARATLSVHAVRGAAGRRAARLAWRSSSCTRTSPRSSACVTSLVVAILLFGMPAVDGAGDRRLRRGVRPAADRLDRPQRHLPVPAHRTARAVRDAAAQHHARHDATHGCSCCWSRSASARSSRARPASARRWPSPARC